MDTIYAMTTPFEAGTTEEVKQGITIFDVAKEVGVGNFIFGSVASANRKTGIPHFDSKYEVEKYITTLGIPYTISAPVFFMDNYLSPFALSSLKEGKLNLAMPANIPLQQISVNNIGAFVATLVERREGVFGKRVDIAGDKLTGEETANLLSKVSGREIRYEGFDPDLLRTNSNDMADMFQWFDDVGYDADIERLHQGYPEVKWQRLEHWAREQDWSIL